MYYRYSLEIEHYLIQLLFYKQKEYLLYLRSLESLSLNILSKHQKILCLDVTKSNFL